MEEGHIVAGGRYRLGCKIRSDMFGDVHAAWTTDTPTIGTATTMPRAQQVSVKLANHEKEEAKDGKEGRNKNSTATTVTTPHISRSSRLEHEYKVYTILHKKPEKEEKEEKGCEQQSSSFTAKTLPGFLRVHWFGPVEENNNVSSSSSSSTTNTSILVLDPLGPSLEDLFKFCDRNFTLKTILMLADEILSRVEFLHSCSLLHRDVKPENLVMGGSSNNQHEVQLIDFGRNIATPPKPVVRISPTRRVRTLRLVLLDTAPSTVTWESNSRGVTTWRPLGTCSFISNAAPFLGNHYYRSRIVKSTREGKNETTTSGRRRWLSPWKRWDLAGTVSLSTT